MKAIKFACFSLTLLFAVSCGMDGRHIKGNGNTVTESRNVQNATSINVLGSMNVVLAEGATDVKLKGDENLLKYVTIEERDGWLEIRTRDGYNLDSQNDLVVYVTTPILKKLKLTGSGDVTSGNKFSSTEPITFSITGSGDLSIPIHAPKINVSIAGSGNFNALGETKEAKVSIAGSGNFNGLELKAENADINIAGSGDVYIFADVSIKANIMGSGGVHYKGNAAVNKSVMGSGEVVKAE